MSWAAGRGRVRCSVRWPGPRRWLARRRGPEGAAGADPEGGGAAPFSASKASPRVWSVSRSMGSHYERPWTKVLPLSLLCTGLLLWCVFRQKTEIDERLEAVFSSQIVNSVAHKSNVPLQPQKEK